MLLKIYKLESGGDVLTVLSSGVHTVGRGPLLQCNDKRVSRNHANIDVTDNSVKLTSIHVNPCFLKKANSKTVTILSKDSTTELENGDKFAFLPDMFWFKTEIVSGENENSKPELKRSIDCELDEYEEKRLKLEENVADVTINSNNLNDSKESINQDEAGPSDANKSSSNGSELKNEEEAGPSNVEIKNETHQDQTATIPESDNKIELTNQSIKVLEPSSSCDIKTEPVKDDKGEPSVNQPPTENEPDQGARPNQPANSGDNCAGTSRPRRDRCWYGSSCYRKNPTHRSDYSHPGDSDYDSDPNDNRPACPFGDDCFRKNKDHRRDYKHPPRQRPCKQRLRKQAKKAYSNDNLGLSDEEEDPFVVDDEGSDYEEESVTSDTEWDDSQVISEESQETTRMLREAKRFTKKK